MEVSVPDLSVTIVSFNTLELTRQCLQSIKDSTRSISYEVWVVDNNSSDGSAEMIEREFPWVHLVTNSVNKGLAAATNQGLEPGSGRYVMALNSDTIITPGAFDELVRFMDEHPEVGGATPKLVLPGGGRHPSFCGEVPTLRTELLEALSPLSGALDDATDRSRFGEEIDYDKTQQVPCILWGTAFIVRREVTDKVGYQDPLFFVYGEDIDWAMRILRAGWKLYLVADVQVVHYGGQSTKQASAKMFAMLLKNKCRFIQKHYGLLQGLLLRLAIAGVCTIRLLKWLVLYPLKGSARKQASARMDQMWKVIRAVLAY